MAYQLYRNTTVGETLQSSLQELIECGAMPASLAHKILLQFDQTVNVALNTRVKSRVVFQAEKLSTYRFCDNVWTFVLKDVDFREGRSELARVDRVKIVACVAKTDLER